MTLTARKPSQELIDLVGALGGAWHGYSAMCRCPAHADSTPSLSLRQGDRSILVTCFAGCAREDVLRELGRIATGQRFEPPSPYVPGTANIDRLWDEAGEVANTLAERYLDRRNLLPVPEDVRFHPRCPYLPRPKTVFLPALLVAVREHRKLVALQRIFLDPDTATYRMKLMLGRPRMGAWQAGGQGRGVLALAEGFETARAFTLLNDIPCWASLGARRFDQIRLPEILERLILAFDNDAEGRRAADKAEEQYNRPNLNLDRMPPPTGFKDWAKRLDFCGPD